MKVELEEIRLAVTAIEKKVVILIPNKDGITIKHKKDVTSDFFKAIIDYGANTKFNISGEKEYEVAVIEKKGFKNPLYSRNEVVKLLTNAVKSEVGEKISIEKWVK